MAEVIDAAARKRTFEAMVDSGVDEVVTTELGHLETFKFVWMIKNFSGIGTEEVKSPVTVSPHGTPHKWQVKARLSEDSSGMEFLGLYMTFVGFGDRNWPMGYLGRKLKVCCVMTLMDGTGSGFKSIGDPDNVIDISQGYAWGHLRVIPVAQLRAPALRRLAEDTLRVNVDLRWYNPGVRYHVGQGPSSSTSQELTKRCRVDLVRDIAHLRQTDRCTDVEIVSRTRTFRAHKSVLLARSRIFAASLTRDTMKLDFKDYPEESVKIMLDYLYTGEVSKAELTENPGGVLIIAELYDFAPLKEMAEVELAAKLHANNVGEILALADAFNAVTLMTLTLAYIKKNPSVKWGRSFQDLAEQKPDLLKRLKIDVPDVYMP